MNNARTVGLAITLINTKIITTNTKYECQVIKTDNSEVLEKVSSFRYLNSWILSTSKVVHERIAIAWQACDKRNYVWKANIRRTLNFQLFSATGESTLMYGVGIWTLTKSQERKQDGSYTRLLSALNVHWNMDSELYSQLTQKIGRRRLQLAGHCYRNSEEPMPYLSYGQQKHAPSWSAKTLILKKPTFHPWWMIDPYGKSLSNLRLRPTDIDNDDDSIASVPGTSTVSNLAFSIAPMYVVVAVLHNHFSPTIFRSLKIPVSYL